MQKVADPLSPPARKQNNYHVSHTHAVAFQNMLLSTDYLVIWEVYRSSFKPLELLTDSVELL